MKIRSLLSGLTLVTLLAGMWVPVLGSSLSKAQQYYFQGEFEQALPYFIEARDKKPDEPMRNYFLGMTYYKLKRYQAAREVFEKVVAIKPEYELARLQLARVSYEMGDYAWANIHLMHLRDIRTKEFEKSDLAMIQAIDEWRDEVARTEIPPAGGKTQLAQLKDVSPPEITVINPKTTRGIQPVRAKTGILIEGFVSDESPLMWVKINGENITLDEKGRFSKNWFLNIGQNDIQIVACDIYLNSAAVSFAVEKEIQARTGLAAPGREKGVPQRYAVVIGIGTYRDRKIPPLQYTVADAQAIYGLLTSDRHGFSEKENVRLLIDAQATTQNIKTTIGAWLKQKVRADDSVIIYFAGHGAPEAGSTYWVTHDADIEDLYGTAISNDSLSAMLRGIASKTIIVFLDSCYSAATVNRGWNTRSLVEKDPFEEFKGEGRVVITSSNGKQLSLEIQEYGHGVFTYYLIHGLTGGADQDLDGYITLDEIWDYVKNKVTATARQFGIHQTPIIDGRHSSGILLSKYPKN